ncbi:MAG: Rrf2 family transcriptional regulator [Phycisphaerae bacterium]|jgi:Rrf2 family protein
MLNQTTLTAIRTLVHVGLARSEEPFSIRRIAEALGESPTYMAKVARLLAKAGILRAHRGVMGGIELNRSPAAITFLAVVEACQGTILPDFCAETGTLAGTCGFHVAAAELHQAIVGVMSRWTLEQFLRQPVPGGGGSRKIPCVLAPCVAPADRTTGSGDRRHARALRTPRKAAGRRNHGRRS